VKQRFPARQAPWIPAATSQAVQASNNRSTLVEQLRRREADTLQIGFNQTSLSGEVYAVYIPLVVFLPVVLMDTTSSNQPQVGSRHEAAQFVVDLCLRHDLDGCGNVQQPQY
jgi:hypothetical protein